MSDKELQPSGAEVKRASRTLVVTVIIISLAVAAVALFGFLFVNRPADSLEGQVEGQSVRVSGKLPGRVVRLYVSEGDSVHQGDTLVYIHSSVVSAQLTQAQAMEQAAQAQNTKARAGTRSQIVDGARDLVAQAEAALTIAQKTYERVNNLYEQGVATAQKRDEARAALDAATAARDAAQSKLRLALDGAQREDIAAADAMTSAAAGSVEQVNALLEDAYLLAPCDGTIDQIFPEEGELVAMGAPIMNILKDSRHVVFNVRETMLKDVSMGTELQVFIPALDKTIKAKVYYIRDKGNYATWRSTKSSGDWDMHTFEIKARPTEDIKNLRPGMTALLPQGE